MRNPADAQRFVDSGALEALAKAGQKVAIAPIRSSSRQAIEGDALRERNPNIHRSRIETMGRGWQEPASTDSNLNRRVEVQWFTLE